MSLFKVLSQFAQRVEEDVKRFTPDKAARETENRAGDPFYRIAAEWLRELETTSASRPEPAGRSTRTSLGMDTALEYIIREVPFFKDSEGRFTTSEETEDWSILGCTVFMVKNIGDIFFRGAAYRGDTSSGCLDATLTLPMD